MLQTEISTQQKNIQYLKISIPIRYGDEDMPYDFPFRHNDIWEVTINLQTFQILNWPKGISADLHLKVCDEGSYFLYDENMSIIAEIIQYYVPNQVVPGEYGDYVILSIDETGKIMNMPEPLIFDAFFRKS